MAIANLMSDSVSVQGQSPEEMTADLAERTRAIAPARLAARLDG
jgi:hypothetical protein